MERTPGCKDEMVPAPATHPNLAFSEPAAFPQVALRLVATIRPVDRSTRATHVRRQLHRYEPLRPRDGFPLARDLADPFGSRLRFLAQPRASAGLRRSFALRASHSKRAVRVAWL